VPAVAAVAGSVSLSLVILQPPPAGLVPGAAPAGPGHVGALVLPAARVSRPSVHGQESPRAAPTATPRVVPHSQAPPPPSSSPPHRVAEPAPEPPAPAPSKSPAPPASTPAAPQPVVLAHHGQPMKPPGRHLGRERHLRLFRLAHGRAAHKAYLRHRHHRRYAADMDGRAQSRPQQVLNTAARGPLPAAADKANAVPVAIRRAEHLHGRREQRPHSASERPKVVPAAASPAAHGHGRGAAAHARDAKPAAAPPVAASVQPTGTHAMPYEHAGTPPGRGAPPGQGRGKRWPHS
jgi:hypothetical protein